LIGQVRRYLADSELRARVAAAGHARCVRDGYDVDSRARQFLVDLEVCQSSATMEGVSVASPVGQGSKDSG
jgi:hypothetical protein